MTVVWLLVNAHSFTLDSARFVPLAAMARHHITLAGLPHCKLRSMRQVPRYTFFNVRASFSQQIRPCQLMYVSLHHAVMLCHASRLCTAILINVMIRTAQIPTLPEQHTSSYTQATCHLRARLVGPIWSRICPGGPHA